MRFLSLTYRHPVTTTNYQLQGQPKDNQPDREGTQGRQEEECARSSRLGRLTFAPRKLKMKVISIYKCISFVCAKTRNELWNLALHFKFPKSGLAWIAEKTLMLRMMRRSMGRRPSRANLVDKFSTSVFELVLTWSGSGSRRSRCGACEYP